MFKKIIFASFLIGITNFVFAQAPKYSNDFLSIGVGARALGMAGVQVATVNDVTSGFWNPAGLCLTKGDIQLALMHSEYFAGIGKYDYGAIAAPIDETRTVGLSVIRFAIDDIIDSTDLIDADGQINYDRLKSFSAADYAFLFSYSKKTSIAGLRYGGNFKVVHRKLGSFASAWGFGLDAGAQYEKDKWKFGAFAKDITSTFNAWTFNTDELETVFTQTGNEIPENGLEITLPRLILGVAYITPLSKKISLQPEVNFDVTFDGKRNVLIKSDPISIDPHIGLEFGYSDFIFLRTGIGNIQTVKDIDGSNSTTFLPSMGVGLKIKNVTIDYALTNFGNTNDQIYSNFFSLRLSIFKIKKNIPPEQQTK
ncbi:MAG: PorV/PorQ family protein [Bacteroidia bacterium]